METAHSSYNIVPKVHCMACLKWIKAEGPGGPASLPLPRFKPVISWLFQDNLM